MRVLTVLGVITVGAVIGTAAVLVPLNSGPAVSSKSWLIDWDVPAVRRMAAMLPDITASKPEAARGTAAAGPASDGAPIVHLAPQGPAEPRAGQSGGGLTSNAFDHLTRPPGPVKSADARAADQPWAATVIPSADGGQRVRPSSKPANDGQRQDLVRAIQSELKRVGCFEGAADGQWSGSTKRAMGQFTVRVNATLPFDEPDLILLTLVKGHRGAACGEHCRTGETLAENGQCQPNGILARADRPRTTDRVKAERPADVAALRPADATDKAAAAEPNGAATTAAIATAAAATKVTQTASAAVAALPQVRAAAPALPAARPQLDTVHATAPLPGRMAIGGPLTPEVPAEESNPVTENAKSEEEASRPDHSAAPKHRQASDKVAAPPPAVTRRLLPPIVIHRAPPPRAPQYTAVQPKKQKWHPVNPFWQPF